MFVFILRFFFFKLLFFCIQLLKSLFCLNYSQKQKYWISYMKCHAMCTGMIKINTVNPRNLWFGRDWVGQLTVMLNVVISKLLIQNLLLQLLIRKFIKYSSSLYRQHYLVKNTAKLREIVFKKRSRMRDFQENIKNLELVRIVN